MIKKEKVPYRVFVIAGSEPLGSAGIQADVKSICTCGGYAAGAITCVVDEDTEHVKDVCLIPVGMVVSQIKSFMEDVGADCIKTGMLYSKELVQKVSETLSSYTEVPLVVDPVMVTSSGDQLIKDDAVLSYKESLIPLATIITPNMREAEILLGRKLNINNIKENLKELSCWGNSVIIKSVPYKDKLLDYFYCPQSNDFREYIKPIIETKNVNGTGDMFASSIATYIARGWRIIDAIDKAEEFIYKSIKYGADFSFGTGFGPIFPFYKDYVRFKKENLRNKIINKLKSQDSESIRKSSELIIRNLMNNTHFRDAEVVLLYHSLSFEVNTHRLIEQIATSKIILLPETNKSGIRLRRYQPDRNLRKGIMDIMEPTGDYFEDYKKINVAVIPGIAFDRYGNRLGHGKGYYDKLLAQLSNVYKIGLCFNFQFVEELPVAENDIKMDIILTTDQK